MKSFSSAQLVKLNPINKTEMMESVNQAILERLSRMRTLRNGLFAGSLGKESGIAR